MTDSALSSSTGTCAVTTGIPLMPQQLPSRVLATFRHDAGDPTASLWEPLPEDEPDASEALRDEDVVSTRRLR